MAVATFTLCILLDQLFTLHLTHDWKRKTKNWHLPLTTIIASLPLLGLLGTINGLLSTFNFMSINNGISQQEVMSGGISDALITTQLGLVLAVPCLILKQIIISRYIRSEVKRS